MSRQDTPIGEPGQRPPHERSTTGTQQPHNRELTPNPTIQGAGNRGAASQGLSASPAVPDDCDSQKVLQRKPRLDKRQRFRRSPRPESRKPLQDTFREPLKAASTSPR